MSRKQVEKTYVVHLSIRVVINVPENASPHQIVTALEDNLTTTLAARGIYKFSTDSEPPVEYEKVKFE